MIILRFVIATKTEWPGGFEVHIKFFKCVVLIIKLGVDLIKLPKFPNSSFFTGLYARPGR